MDIKRVDLIGVQVDLGASKRGVDMGPNAIRHGGVCKGLTNLEIPWEDRGDLIPKKEGKTSDRLRNYEQVNAINEELFHEVTKSLNEGAFPVVLGGDHSIAAGSVMAVAQKYKNIGLIWIDAHGDWNNEKSSLSGNMHGMPFSAVCGGGPAEMVSYVENPVFVDPKKAVQIGGRDIDPSERIRMKKAGVTVFSIADIDKFGILEITNRAMAIASNGTEGFHVSYDVDAITPESAPGTGTPVHSGLTVRESFLLIEILHQSKKMLALDMVEVNPILDIQNRTGILASELILAALGKTVF